MIASIVITLRYRRRPAKPLQMFDDEEIYAESGDMEDLKGRTGATLPLGEHSVFVHVVR